MEITTDAGGVGHSEMEVEKSAFSTSSGLDEGGPLDSLEEVAELFHFSILKNTRTYARARSSIASGHNNRSGSRGAAGGLLESLISDNRFPRIHDPANWLEREGAFCNE